MSRAKAADVSEAGTNEVLAAENEAVPELPASSGQAEPMLENGENSTENAAAETVQRINLTSYLEINPQSAPIEGLMRKNYGLQFNSKSDWDLILQKLSEKKID